MCPKGLKVQQFEIHPTSGEFTMLLRLLDSGEVNLTFLEKGTVNVLVAALNPDFKLETYDRDLYKKIRNFFHINYNPDADNAFTLFDFYKQIDSSWTPIFPKKINRTETIRLYNFKDKNGIYYDHMVNWDTTSTGNLYSNENRAKVQALLPELATQLVDLNISVFFSDKVKNEQEERKAFLKQLQAWKK